MKPKPPLKAWGASFDGDGLTDLAFVEGYHKDTSVFNGPLTVAPAALPKLLTNTGDDVFAAGDVNGDGFTDLLTVKGPGSPDALPYSPGIGRVYLGGSGGLAPEPVRILTEPAAEHYYFGCSAGGVGDADDDGYADIVVCSHKAARLYRGGAGGLVAGDGIALATACSTWGDNRQVTFLGDVNGDGLTDFAVADQHVANIYAGAKGKVATQSSWSVVFEGDYPQVPYVGDLNGDGFDDIVVAQKGRVGVFVGGVAGPNQIPVRVLEGLGRTLSSDHFGLFVAGAGDVNGDGRADLLVGDICASGGKDGCSSGKATGAVYLYIGTPDGIAATPVPGSGQLTGFAQAIGIGDVDGDGFDDIAAPQSGPYRVLVFRGTPLGLPSQPAVTLTIGGDEHYWMAVTASTRPP